MLFKIIRAINSKFAKLRYSAMFPASGALGGAFKFAEKEHEVFSRLVNTDFRIYAFFIVFAWCQLWTLVPYLMSRRRDIRKS